MAGPAAPWDLRYGQAAFFYGTEPNDFLKGQAGRLSPGARVLSIGEGEGRNATYLASLGLQVTGVDASGVGLAKGQELAAGRGLSWEAITADLAQYDMGRACWDAVVSIWCHTAPDLRGQLRKAIAAGLKPGGLFVLEHYHPDQVTYKTGGPPDRAMMDTLEELAGQFPGWEVLHRFEGEREVREGSGHHGLSKVTQFVARKSG